ncbi:MAG: PEGA domain-containing protein [Deltaproteobacteria bacterium]|nr:PEGA domain-containing protein [Deltaproteobacteria bacterium]
MSHLINYIIPIVICLVTIPGLPASGAETGSSKTSKSGPATDLSNKQHAIEHFNTGVEMMRNGEFENAALAFERANKLYSTRNGFFNLATCYVEMARYVDAARTISSLKGTYGVNIDEKLQSDLIELEKKIQASILQVALEVNVDGAQVVIDGKPFGSTPINSPIILPLKEHKMVVSREGYESQTTTIRPEEKKLNISLTLYRLTQQEESLAPLVPEEEESEGPTRRKRVWTWVAYGIGGAAGIGAIVTGTKAISLNRDVQDNCVNDVCPIDQKDDVDKAESLGIAANVLIGVTVVGLTAGTILFFVEGKNKKKRTALLPSITPNSAGVTLMKTF